MWSATDHGMSDYLTRGRAPMVSCVAARVSRPPRWNQKQPVRRPTITYCMMSCLLIDWNRLTRTALQALYRKRLNSCRFQAPLLSACPWRLCRSSHSRRVFKLRPERLLEYAFNIRTM